jgi:hypothetical protein
MPDSLRYERTQINVILKRITVAIQRDMLLCLEELTVSSSVVS